MGELSAGDIAGLVLAFVVGSLPISNVLAWLAHRVDLRRVGSGTVSGTSLFAVGGMAVGLVGGILDVAKGAAAVTIVGPSSSLAPWAAGLCVTGHNWSPFLRGAGGRGVGPALGALLLVAWPGSLWLLGALAIGRMLNHSGLGTFIGVVTLPLFVLGTSGGREALAGVLIAAVMLLKRLTGNTSLLGYEQPGRIAVHRLLFDNDGLTAGAGLGAAGTERAPSNRPRPRDGTS